MEKLIDSDLQKEPSEVFEIECKLGKGSYGSVYKARHKQNGCTVAAKLVPVDSELSDIVKEISIMQQCRSEFIVQYYGSFYDSRDLWIVMEYCGAGSISDIMRLLGRTCSEHEIAVIVRGALCGLDYIHQMKKIHRDVKAGNILLTEEGCAKLADFGVAGQLSDTLAKRNTVIGTPYWMAPEVIQEVGYTCSADIWSLGITVIEMADGRPPHADVHPMRALFMIPSHPPPTLSSPIRWTSSLISFLTQCLQKSPEHRPSASSLLFNSPFVKDAPSAKTLIPAIKQANEARLSRHNDMESLSSSLGASRNESGIDNETMVHYRDSTDGSSKSQSSMIIKDSGASLSNSVEAPTMLINATDDDSDVGGDTLTQEEARRLYKEGGSRATKNGIQDKSPQKKTPSAFNPHSLINVEEIYRNLETKSYSELEELLNRIDSDLKAELTNLEIRYLHKRQPLLDAIDDKSKMATRVDSK